MRLPTRAHNRTLQFNMTPLIDVVFLLIIFFLVSSHLARQETQLALNLPSAVTGERELPVVRPRVTINVLASGEIHLGSIVAAPEELARRLRYEQEHAPSALEVRIRGDRSVPYGHVEPILLACAEAGVWNVTFAVVDQSPSGQQSRSTTATD